ncbi:PREDICTED: ribosome biogenesis protein BRX1 homolog [Vollenhovia emeryi]|uniref:ribosome biogenesis protein BRX1 homolog n=1 Tax=Vollenhovia emeryi TaxID=411798 RepID=UPI0005F36710|nr:PREDICTED: ribosome biogenesis protein BRX1 homolog [Vollenhovia emeryi]XP_011866936.1 PREDICTED: ribosome biogenesis protein BRX1 homolog [Vollenhovia emeryi]
MAKKKLKQKEDEVEEVTSDEPAAKKVKWINRQRVLVFATRGINHRHRHLMEDLRKLMPHHRAECKMERSRNLQVVNEMCEMKHCNKAVLFEGRMKRDLYVWLANVPTGPSAKFLVENIHTMGELKMTGNCLRGSRPLLSFDENFTTHAHYILLKELLTQIFGVPNHHPKSQPFIDHVYTFTILDNRIWFRNFQILTEDGALTEIGPRFVLNPVKIFGGSFGSDTLWDNPHYISPAKFRQSLKKKAANNYTNRVEQKMVRQATKPEFSYAFNPTDEIFKGDALEKAIEMEEKFKTDKSENVKEPVKIKGKNKVRQIKKKPAVAKKENYLTSIFKTSKINMILNNK